MGWYELLQRALLLKVVPSLVGRWKPGSGLLFEWDMIEGAADRQALEAKGYLIVRWSWGGRHFVSIIIPSSRPQHGHQTVSLPQWRLVYIVGSPSQPVFAFLVSSEFQFDSSSSPK